MLIKCKEHKEIFLIEGKQKCWIENWETYVYMGFGPVAKEVTVVSFEKLRDEYPVGATKVKKTVTSIVEGKKPRDIFYPEKPPPPPVTIRKMAILGTCLPGCEEMMKELGFTHAYGNRYGWPDYDEVERLGMRVFINIRGASIREHMSASGLLIKTRYEPDAIPDDDAIRSTVLAWKDRPGCGGYWSDTLGHEPDICNQPMSERIRFYKTVRKYDPDMQNHPVMEMMNNTSFYDFPDGQYPGWEKGFSDETHDLLLFDCYPGMDEGSIKNMENTWNKFIKVFPHKHQVIPQMQAFNYQKGGIWRQYNFWKEKMSSVAFDNPYRGQIGVCWYKDETVRQNAEMQKEIKEVIAEAMK